MRHKFYKIVFSLVIFSPNRQTNNFNPCPLNSKPFQLDIAPSLTPENSHQFKSPFLHSKHLTLPMQSSNARITTFPLTFLSLTAGVRENHKATQYSTSHVLTFKRWALSSLTISNCNQLKNNRIYIELLKLTLYICIHVFIKGSLPKHKLLNQNFVNII